MSGHTPTIDGVETTPTATAAETAAITAAIETYIRERQAAAATDETPESGWDGERFAFAGRLNALGCEPARVPRNGPTDRWTAAGRTDRYER